jgi:hypothetical protein
MNSSGNSECDHIPERTDYFAYIRARIAAVPESGPGLPTGRRSEVGSFLGRTGRAADIVAATAHDPKATLR